MKRGGPTRLGIGLMVLIVAVVMIGGLIWVGKTLFKGQTGGSTADTVSAGQKLLAKPTADTLVRMSVRGPITAQEAHYSIAETISPTSRNLIIWRGYDGAVMTQENLANSRGSFDDLLAALDRAGMMKKTSQDPGANNGICATGQLINFEILENVKNKDGSTSEKSVEKLWTTSCTGIGGNFAGLASNVIALFLDQIPDARNRIAAAKNDLTTRTNASIGDPWDGLAAFKIISVAKHLLM